MFKLLSPTINHLNALSLPVIYQTNPLYLCLLVVFLWLQTGAHKFKHQITLLCVIFENTIQDMTHMKQNTLQEFADRWLNIFWGRVSLQKYDTYSMLLWKLQKILLSCCCLLVYGLQCRWIMKTCNLNKILTLSNVRVEHVSSC